jgi:uncharacterized membrane protein
MVGHALKHHTAVDVSIVGVRITEESGYKATLTAVFADGSRRQRSIEGVSQRKYLNNIRPEYSRVYQVCVLSYRRMSGARVARFFSGYSTPKRGKNTIDRKYVVQTAINYTKFFHFEALQNLPKMVSLVCIFWRANK